MKKWFKYAGVQALKAMVRTAVAMLNVSTALSDINWIRIGSASLLAGVLSLLTSVTDLPMLEGDSLT